MTQPSPRVGGKRLTDHFWIIVIILAFAAVYAASLSFVYIEGDDEAIIAYHTMGRNPTLIAPYSPYHSMLDAIFSLLPADEHLLRNTAMGLTSIAAVGVVILILGLAFDWFGEDFVRRKWLTALVVIMAAPEFFYLGMVYLPSVIAMSLLLASHLILRRTVRHANLTDLSRAWKQPGIVVALLLFGLGAACRWDTAAYIVFIVVDIFVGLPHGAETFLGSLRKRLTAGIVYGVCASIALFIATAISGYSPFQVLEVASQFLLRAAGRSSEGGVGVSTSASLEIFAAWLSLFTPAYVLLLAVGLITLVRRRSRLIWPILAGMVAVAPWFISGAPKNFIAGIPAMTIAVIYGFELLWNALSVERTKFMLRAAIVVLLIGPWLIGIRIDRPEAWGPGFELQGYDRPVVTGTHPSITLGAGVALPLPDGPRALFGHAWALLGGQWRTLVNLRMDGELNAATVAASMGIPQLRTDRQNPALVIYAAEGYRYTSYNNDGVLGEWNFTDAGGKQALLFALYDRNAIYTKAGVNKIRQLANGPKVVIFGYPSALRELYELQPDSLQKIGPTTAILDLDELSKAAGLS